MQLPKCHRILLCGSDIFFLYSLLFHQDWLIHCSILRPTWSCLFMGYKVQLMYHKALLKTWLHSTYRYLYILYTAISLQPPKTQKVVVVEQLNIFIYCKVNSCQVRSTFIWSSGAHGFNTRRVWQHSFVEIMKYFLQSFSHFL